MTTFVSFFCSRPPQAAEKLSFYPLLGYILKQGGGVTRNWSDDNYKVDVEGRIFPR